jgi:hypothetical protein
VCLSVNIRVCVCVCVCVRAYVCAHDSDYTSIFLCVRHRYLCLGEKVTQAKEPTHA